MARILKTKAIFRETPPTGGFPHYDEDTMDELVGNYWGDIQERVFPISFFEIKELLASSSSGEAALRVTDITDKTQVRARWVVFDSLLEGALSDPIQEGVYYFVMDEDFFNGPIILSNSPLATVGGLSDAVEDPVNSIIVARLGKNDAGQFNIFFQLATWTLPEGVGGDGATTGLKIPIT